MAVETMGAAAEKVTVHTDYEGVVVTIPAPADNGSWHRGTSIKGEKPKKEEEEALAFLSRFFFRCSKSLC